MQKANLFLKTKLKGIIEGKVPEKSEKSQDFEKENKNVNVKPVIDDEYEVVPVGKIENINKMNFKNNNEEVPANDFKYNNRTNF